MDQLAAAQKLIKKLFNLKRAHKFAIPLVESRAPLVTKHIGFGFSKHSYSVDNPHCPLGTVVNRKFLLYLLWFWLLIPKSKAKLLHKKTQNECSVDSLCTN